MVTNRDVAALMSNQGFFYDVRIISQIFKPIKQIIHCLEQRSANLSDCFLGFVYLALAIKQLPNNMNLQSEIIKIFNSRFNSFEIISATNSFFAISVAIKLIVCAMHLMLKICGNALQIFFLAPLMLDA